MLAFEDVKQIILEELRNKGYNPNPADVLVATTRIIELSKQDDEKENLAKVKELASAGTPLIQVPPKP